MTGLGVAVVGVAEAEVGWQTDLTAEEIMAEATRRALAEAGLGMHEVDGLLAATPYCWMPSVSLGEQLGVQPSFTDSTNIGGASFVSHLGHAVEAIRSGRCEVAAIAYGSTQRSDTGRLVTRFEPSPYEVPYGLFFPISSYALVAQRHMYEFGTTREQLALVAVSARQWAALNPAALRREPLTVEDVLASRLISDPLRKLDCCLVTNGGGAVILAAEDRARHLRQRPVFVLGHGESHIHLHICAMPDLTTTAAVASGRQAFSQAGLGPDEVDVVEIYDAFTINVIVALEDLGFCEKGAGGPLVQQGIGPGGRLPVNTSGGGLSYCHPGMFGIFLIVEAVRQLRGECGARGVAGARRALVHGIGGVMTGHATAILGV